MPKGLSREAEQKWNLLAAGQDSYAGQNAQDPRTSRKVQSWIVQDDGQLHRELQEPQYASNQLPGPIVGLYEFDQNNGQGGVVRNYYCAARVNSTVGTQNCLFYSYVGGAWATVTTVGTLANAPMCVVQENNSSNQCAQWQHDDIRAGVHLKHPNHFTKRNRGARRSNLYFL